MTSDYVARSAAGEIWYVINNVRRRLHAEATRALLPQGAAILETPDSNLASLPIGSDIGPGAYLARAAGTLPIFLVEETAEGLRRHLISTRAYFEKIGFDPNAVKEVNAEHLESMPAGSRLENAQNDQIGRLGADLKTTLQPPTPAVRLKPPFPPARLLIKQDALFADINTVLNDARGAALLLASADWRSACRFASDVEYSQRRSAQTLLIMFEADGMRLRAKGAGLVEARLAPSEGERLLHFLAALKFVRAEVFTGVAAADRQIEQILDSMQTAFAVTFTDARWVGPAIEAPTSPPFCKATELNACSSFLAGLLEERWPDARVKAVFPPEPDQPARFKVSSSLGASSGEPLKVLILARRADADAFGIVVQCADQIRRRELPIRLFLLGDDESPAFENEGDEVMVDLSGGRRFNLNTVVCSLRPHVAWFPYTSPPVFDYWLSEAMLNGLPVLAAASGSTPERLAGRPQSWLVDSHATSECWLVAMEDIRQGRAPMAALGELKASPAIDLDLYGPDYLFALENKPADVA